MGSRVEKQLIDIREKVRCSKLHDWDKRLAYEAIVKLARVLNMVEED